MWHSTVEENKQWWPWLRADEPIHRGGGRTFSYRAGDGRSSLTDDGVGGGRRDRNGYSRKESSKYSGNPRKTNMANDSEESVAFHTGSEAERDSRERLESNQGNDPRVIMEQRNGKFLNLERTHGLELEVGNEDGLLKGHNTTVELKETNKEAHIVSGL